MRLVKFIVAITATFLMLAIQVEIAKAAGPSLQSASLDSVTGTNITLTFDDLSGNANQSLMSDYTVTGSVQGSITVINVLKSGNNIRVRVGTLISGGQTISLAYTPTSSVPANAAGENLTGFTTPVAHPGAAVIPSIGAEELLVSMSNPTVLQPYFYSRGVRYVCALTAANFQIKVNGTIRPIASIAGGDCSTTLRITLSSALIANDQVTFSYIPSPGSFTTIFGTPAAALTDAKVFGIPDTIPPFVTLSSTNNFLFGQGGSIALQANEPVGWGVTTDRTLSFQIIGNQLMVSSILPIGSYTVGVTATDDGGNETTRSITVNITAVAPTPTPAPISTPKPNTGSPIANKPATFKSCSLLNKKHPGGVAYSYTSRNKGAGMNFIPRVDPALYKANVKLDKDKDGIACER